MPISLARVLGMGMPRTPRCPYHYDRTPVLITKNKLQSALALGTPPYNGFSLLRGAYRVFVITGVGWNSPLEK